MAFFASLLLPPFAAVHIVQKNTATLCACLFLWVLLSCNRVTKAVAPSAQQDSLHVENLLRKGDSLYALRSGFSTISESMVYFDSAARIARRLGATLLQANTLFYIGNVYNAWNKEPQTTVDYYRRSLALYNTLPQKKVKAFYLRYIIAHAFDGEKMADSLRCVQTVQEALQAVRQQPDSLRQKMMFLSDFAWVATNSKAYTLAEDVLAAIAPRNRIFNDPESNNYLDHYYLTRSRIDVYKYRRRATPYIDSLALALQHCNNRFDSGYYSLNLSELYAATGNHAAAYRYLKLNTDLQKALDNSNVLSSLQKELLNRELAAEREKERRTKEELKNKNLYLLSLGLALLAIGLLVFLYLLYRRRAEERKEGARQEQFTYLLLQNEEEERKRIAADLHDGINHELLGLKNKLLLRKPVVPEEVERIITSVREVSRNLYPALFESVGLTASIEALCEGMTRVGFFTTCEIHYQLLLSKEVELQVYRIVQEALANVAKHAKAEACKITIKTQAQQLWVEIKDNGKGFDAGKWRQGKTSFGLQSMAQRAKAMKAVLSIESGAGGTVIILSKRI